MVTKEDPIDTETTIRNYLEAKSNRIKNLIGDTELKDEYREENIRDVRLFNKIIDENLEIVNNSLTTYKECEDIDKKFDSKATGVFNSEINKINEELKTNFNAAVPLKIKNFIGMDDTFFDN